MQQHPHDEVLLVYADDVSSCSERNSVEDHLARCASCQERLMTIRQQLAGPPALSPRTVAKVIEFEETIRREEDEAAPLIQTLVRKLPEDGIPSDSRLETVGGLLAVLKVIPDVCNRAPSTALRFAEVALGWSEAIPAGRYDNDTLRHLRGMLFKEKANALRTLGRFAEALTALDYAEDQFTRNAVSEFDLASVWYNRAATLREIDDLDQALLWISEAADTYRRFGEVRRLNRADYMHAAILFRQCRFAEAKAIFESLVVRSEHDGDDETTAATYGGLASAEVELGDLASAEQHIVKSERIYKLLDDEIGILKLQWIYGRLLLQSARFDAAIRTLRQVQESFRRLEMNEDVALTGLDISEAFLAIGRPAEAGAECEDVMDTLRRSRSPVNVLRSVEYLREATADRRATHTLAREVRRFVEHASRMPQEKFQPPA